MCVCSLRYPACNAHAPYCHLWAVRLYNIFAHYLLNGTIFEREVTGHKKCVLISSTTFVWNISRSNIKWARLHKQPNMMHFLCVFILQFVYNSKCFERPFRSPSAVHDLLYLQLCANHADVSNCWLLRLGPTGCHTSVKKFCWAGPLWLWLINMLHKLYLQTSFMSAFLGRQ